MSDATGWNRFRRWLGLGDGDLDGPIRDGGQHLPLRTRRASPRRKRLILDTSLEAVLPEGVGRRTPRVSATNWACQMQGENGAQLSVATISACDADCVITDYSRDGSDASAFTVADVQTMKQRPSGTPKAVVAYMSIGEAGHERYYWNNAWIKNGRPQRGVAPPWLYQPNDGGWTGDWKVRFWDSEWQAIIADGPQSYLDRIIDAGFDGVFLDIVDAAEFWVQEERGADRHMKAGEDMIAFVAKIAAHARETRGHQDFLVIPNGDLLIESAHYRAIISGLLREEIIYEAPGGGKPVTHRPATGENSIDDIAKRLAYAAESSLPVLAIEYLLDHGPDKQKIPGAVTELTRLGPNIRPYFSVRNLDRLCPEYRAGAAGV